MTSAIKMIEQERKRQKRVHRWSKRHDDSHDRGELAMAAAAYAMPRSERGGAGTDHPPPIWPWQEDYWRPKRNDRIRELVKAGALLVAEIERLKRAETKKAKAKSK